MGMLAHGGTLTGTGIAAAPVSGGASLVMSAAGVAEASIGAFAIQNAIKNFSKTKNSNNSGKESSSKNNEGKKNNTSSGNKNSPHANQKAKEAAQRKFNDAKEKFDNLNTKSNKSPEDKKELKRLENQVKHLQQRKDFAGENHSRNSKGNK